MLCTVQGYNNIDGDALKMSRIYFSCQECSARFRDALQLVGMHCRCQGRIADVRDAGIDAKWHMHHKQPRRF